MRVEKRSHPCVAGWGSAHRTQGTPDPSARSPHECARDPPVGCASAAGLLLCVRSDGTVSHVAPPAPPRGVAPRPPGQGDGELCRRSTRVSKGNDFSGKKRGINYFIRWKNFSGVRGSSEWSVSTSGYTNQYGTCRCATDCRAGTVWSGLPGQRRGALPAEVLRLSAPGWSAVCLAHCSSSESGASFARRGAASVLAGEIGSGLEGALEGRL